MKCWHMMLFWSTADYGMKSSGVIGRDYNEVSKMIMTKKVTSV